MIASVQKAEGLKVCGISPEERDTVCFETGEPSDDDCATCTQRTCSKVAEYEPFQSKKT
jgi:hypothetical protein